MNSDHGYRFDEPTTHHFCLLKAVRVVGALNASVELARRGYTQEIAVLMRTVAEFTTHIEFVLDMDDSAEHELKVKNYIEAFFADSRRDPEAELKKAQVPQGIVHISIGRTLDKLMAEQAGSVEGRIPAASLYSNVYRIYSNYVHGKYPEIMDLYGGMNWSRLSEQKFRVDKWSLCRVRPPRGAAEVYSRLDPGSCRQGSNVVVVRCKS